MMSRFEIHFITNINLILDHINDLFEEPKKSELLKTIDEPLDLDKTIILTMINPEIMEFSVMMKISDLTKKELLESTPEILSKILFTDGGNLMLFKCFEKEPLIELIKNLTQDDNIIDENSFNNMFIFNGGHNSEDIITGNKE